MKSLEETRGVQAGKKSSISPDCVMIIAADFGVECVVGEHMGEVFDRICEHHGIKMTCILKLRKKATMLRAYLLHRTPGGGRNFAQMILKEIKRERARVRGNAIMRKRPKDWLENRRFGAVTKAGAVPEGRVVLGGLPDSKFCLTKEWQTLRYSVLRKYGAKCMCCGATSAEGERIEVDHILPRSSYPELALDIRNLQVLCRTCNSGKSNIFRDDWTAENDGWPLFVDESAA